MSDTPSKTEAPSLTDAEMLARFQNSKKRPPCSMTLGMRLESVDQANQTITMSFEASTAFANPMGSIQGGFVGAMLDEAIATCGIIASNVTKTMPTLEIKISYLRPLFPGKALAKAWVLKMGNTAAFIEAELYGEDGKLVAKASSTVAPKPFKRF
ncbi:MAG: PaaI family thioesterase [Pseudomonadota bacterium]